MITPGEHTPSPRNIRDHAFLKLKQLELPEGCPVAEWQKLSANTGRAALPEVIDLECLPDWRSRNQAITHWYHSVDQLMTGYLGDVTLPSWARFAKHASFNAGQTLAELERSIELAEDIRDCGKHAVAAIKQFDFKRFQKSIRHFREAFEGLINLMRAPDAIECAAIASLIELNGPSESSRRLASRFHENPGSLTNTWRATLKCLRDFPAIMKDLPETIDNLKKLFSTVAKSNCQIYTFMAPKLDAFLQRELFDSTTIKAPDFSREDESQTAEFLNHALRLYSDVAHSTAPWGNKVELVLRANLLATYGEQLHRVQPEFAEVATIIDNMKLLMRFSFPDGSQTPLAPAASSWTDINQRFGFRSECGEISSETLGAEQLRDLGDPLFTGTIGEMILRGTLDSDFALLLFQEPGLI